MRFSWDHPTKLGIPRAISLWQAFVRSGPGHPTRIFRFQPLRLPRFPRLDDMLRIVATSASANCRAFVAAACGRWFTGTTGQPPRCSTNAALAGRLDILASIPIPAMLRHRCTVSSLTDQNIFSRTTSANFRSQRRCSEYLCTNEGDRKRNLNSGHRCNHIFVVRHNCR